MHPVKHNRLLRALVAASTVLALAVPFASALACTGEECCRLDNAHDGAQHRSEAPCHESHQADPPTHVPHHSGGAMSAYAPPGACPMMEAIGTINVAPLLVGETLAPHMPVLVQRGISSSDTVPNRHQAQLTPPPRA